MRFTWDSRKAAMNAAKHGVSFEEARTVFLDFLAVTGFDPDHGAGEARWITIGESSRGRLLTIAHSEHGNVIRIISARVVTRSERRLYEEG